MSASPGAVSLRLSPSLSVSLRLSPSLSVSLRLSPSLSVSLRLSVSLCLSPSTRFSPLTRVSSAWCLYWPTTQPMSAVVRWPSARVRVCVRRHASPHTAVAVCHRCVHPAGAVYAYIVDVVVVVAGSRAYIASPRLNSLL